MYNVKVNSFLECTSIMDANVFATVDVCSWLIAIMKYTSFFILMKEAVAPD